MQENYKKPTRVQKEIQLNEIISTCRQLAQDYIKNWKPLNGSWKIIEGCAYLRLSTDEQVLVEKGSLEQQVNIAVSEANLRSQNDEINYKITKFFIEPGITGRHDNRPEFNLMIKTIRQGLYKFVVIKEIARIAREISIWKDFFNLCIEKHCEIFIRGFPFNPNDPAQIFQLDLLAAFAEYESNQNSKRVKESIFSAMITSGKFNSTRIVLGLDQQIINGEPKVGFYSPNTEELKTVEWIMRSFNKYASFQKTIEECNKRGIRNKNGQAFKKHSLHSLLTNTKYIGTWEVNRENKERDQDKLMPYDRYAFVDLPHGCIIDKGLWDQTQDTIRRISGNKNKNTMVKRIYPLSGLLKHSDGSSFGGTGAWGRNNVNNYYWNKTHDLRVPVDVAETEAKNTVAEIIQNSPKLREAIMRKGIATTSAIQLLEQQAKKLDSEISQLENEKLNLGKRLDFLLADGDDNEAGKFRKEYKGEFNRINGEIQCRRESLSLIDKRGQELRVDGFDYKDLAKRAREIQDIMQECDPVALKNAYRDLFESVIVGDVDKGGKLEFQFVLRDGLSDAVTVGAKSSTGEVVLPGT